MTSSAHLFNGAQRPLIVFGGGVQCARELAVKWAERANVPVVLTWGAADLMHDDHRLNVGRFGTHGLRHANFAVQTADRIVTVGTRLDTKATGSPVSSFAPRARITMVDIDPEEIDKFGKLGRAVEGICADARDFLQIEQPRSDTQMWQLRIAMWRAQFPCSSAKPYKICAQLSNMVKPDDVIVSDTGCVLGWMMQAFKFRGQRFIHAWNNTPMGYGLPAAIGAHLATGKKVWCITGDGGLSVHTPELATIVKHQWPITVVLFNNKGHAMCRQTQRQWLDGRYVATDEDFLSMADFSRVARSYAYEALLELHIDPDEGIEPQVRFGAGLEDGDPRLDPEELKAALSV